MPKELKDLIEEGLCQGRDRTRATPILPKLWLRPKSGIAADVAELAVPSRRMPMRQMPGCARQCSRQHLPELWRMGQGCTLLTKRAWAWTVSIANRHLCGLASPRPTWANTPPRRQPSPKVTGQRAADCEIVDDLCGAESGRCGSHRQLISRQINREGATDLGSSPFFCLHSAMRSAQNVLTQIWLSARRSTLKCRANRTIPKGS